MNDSTNAAAIVLTRVAYLVAIIVGLGVGIKVAELFIK